jgi:raffinose/stachyose/melibiose transport system permease protein
MKQENARRKWLTGVFIVVCVIYLMPIFTVLMNSFKSNSSINTDTFAFPNAQSFVGTDNYVNGINVGEYPFLKSAGYSLLITITSSALILVCTSMAAWYISRVNSVFARIVYYLCVFSMVVPFQMVMFTLAKTATHCIWIRHTRFRHLSGVRRGARGVYVRGLRQRHPARD